MIISFKEFIKESYSFSGTWTYTLELEDVMRSVISDCLYDQHENPRHIQKLTDTIYDLFYDWYDENIPAGQDLYELDIKASYSGENDPGNYDTAPYYSCDIDDDIECDKKDLETLYNQILSFFDTDPSYADMKEQFTIDKLKESIDSVAVSKFEDHDGQFDEYVPRY